MEKYLSYNDVCLVPRYSELESRSLADTSVNLCGSKFRIPAVPANMQTVINEKIAHFLSENSYFYIMHRFNTNQYDFVCNAQNWKLVSISCGVNKDTDEFNQLQLLSKNNLRIDFATVDVAHGDHIKVKNRISWLKENFPNTKIIAGNVATPTGAFNLIKWGADIIKIGVGGGVICTTRFQTSFHVPMFSCVKNCYDFLNYTPNYKIAKKIPIIADGSVQHIGDIAKAINAGATMVMCGKLFAECIDSPAEIINGKKQYYGSTSFEAKKENKHIEGKLIEIDHGVTIEERLKEIQMALQSSISYSGGSTLNDLRMVDYIHV